MDLALRDEQAEIWAAFEQFFARESSSERVRAAEVAGYDPALWRASVELGVLDIMTVNRSPTTAHGLLNFAFVAEAAGRHTACIPLVEAVVAVQLLTAAGGFDDVVAQAREATELVVFAPRPADGGTAVLTPAGAACSAVVALDGDDLVLVKETAKDRAEATVRNTTPAGADDLGFMAAADRRLTGADVERRTVTQGSRARQLWADALATWQVATAASCAGLAAAAVAEAAAYAGQREQFGVPIGSFQAVQERLADVVIDVDGAELLAREAAWRHDCGHEAWRDGAVIAYAFAARAATAAAQACLHVHGGYGYTLEYDAQLYLRRAKALQLACGDPELLWAQIGTLAIETRR